jgi:hypothetical protein
VGGAGLATRKQPRAVINLAAIGSAFGLLDSSCPVCFSLPSTKTGHRVVPADADGLDMLVTTWDHNPAFRMKEDNA